MSLSISTVRLHRILRSLDRSSHKVTSRVFENPAREGGKMKPKGSPGKAVSLLAVVLLIGAVFTIAGNSGCRPPASARADVDNAIRPDLPAYDGPMARLTIGRFDWKVGSQGGAVNIETPEGVFRWNVQAQSDYMGGLESMLTTAFMKSERYQVLEGDLDPLKDEIGLGESGYVKDESAVEKGGWEGADLVVIAEVTEWDPDAAGKTIGGGGILGGVLGGAKLGKKKASMAMHIRLVDPRSRITICSEGVRGEATSWNFGIGGGALVSGGALLGGLSEYEKTPMGEAISICIAEAVKLVVNETPQKYFKHM
jgi:curli biogenesis system outer membrane secretion channel CsgG